MKMVNFFKLQEFAFHSLHKNVTQKYQNKKNVKLFKKLSLRLNKQYYTRLWKEAFCARQQ